MPNFSRLCSPDNVLLLTRSSKFQDTTQVSGACYVPAVSSVDIGAKNYFSGYVFRGDTRFKEVVLSKGFELVLIQKL